MEDIHGHRSVWLRGNTYKFLISIVCTARSWKPHTYRYRDIRNIGPIQPSDCSQFEFFSFGKTTNFDIFTVYIWHFIVWESFSFNVDHTKPIESCQECHLFTCLKQINTRIMWTLRFRRFFAILQISKFLSIWVFEFEFILEIRTRWVGSTDFEVDISRLNRRLRLDSKICIGCKWD